MSLAFTLGGAPNWRLGYFRNMEFVLHLVQAAPKKPLNQKGQPVPHYAIKPF
jgi:hypothetical protein